VDVRCRAGAAASADAGGGGGGRSYPARSPAALDYFFDLTDSPRSWIAALDGHGSGLVQTSTHRLRGRKLFLWGSGPGGQHWQRWLSPRGGRYLEIQAGLARTQLEHLPLPAGTRWSWLETYGPLHLDPTPVHDPDWAVGVREVERALAETAPLPALEAVEAEGLATVDRAPVELLHAGSGWGALEQRRRAVSGEGPWALPGTPFPADTLGPEQQPWLDLLQHGSLELDLRLPPPSYQVAPEWRVLLAPTGGAATALLRGVAEAYAGDDAAAVASWTASLAQQPNAWAWRNLAVLRGEHDGRNALQAYVRARELAPDLAPLAVEQLTLMLELGMPDELLATLDALPAAVVGRPEVRLLEARAAVALGDAARAGAVLEPGLVVPQIREGARLLEDLWYGYRALVLVADGVAVDEAHAQARREPLPAVYDFSMTAPAT